MTQDIFRPLDVPPALRPFVRRVLLGAAPAPLDITIPVRPSGYVYLGWVIRGTWEGFAGGAPIYNSGADGTLAFAGQITRPDITLRMSGTFALLNVEFTVTGLYRAFGVDAERLNDRVVSLPALDLPLPDGLAADPSDEAAVLAQLERIFAPAVSSPKSAPKGIAEAADLLETMGGNIAMAELAERCGLSERSLRRGFNRCAGIGPKAFARCVQVNTVLAEILSKPPQDLAALAQDYGYADQSHMTHSFMQFLGSTPGAARGGLEPTLKRFVGYSQAQQSAGS
jgi:AraC-like DNA-binding protein